MSRKSIFGWFLFADTDLALTEHALLMYPKPLEAICYHCQQAVEKYIKGYLLFNGMEAPPKTHNLMQLCAMASSFNPHFDDIQEKCSTLTAYGVQPRYPDEIYIDESLMEQALDCAKQIRVFEPLSEARQQLEKEQ